MTPNTPGSHIEVEAKFLGGKAEFQRILATLEQEGFSVSPKPPTHRLHVYFDDGNKLRQAGCRLRCVIASGEWCRYDFKADDPTEHGETTEISVKKSGPVSINEAVSELVGLMCDGEHKSTLLALKDAVRVTMVMIGSHEKAVLRRDGLEVELSWDVLIPIESGVHLSEIEIELLSGDRKLFDAFVSHVERSLELTRSHSSKLDRAFRGS